MTEKKIRGGGKKKALPRVAASKRKNHPTFTKSGGYSGRRAANSRRSKGRCIQTQLEKRNLGRKKQDLTIWSTGLKVFRRRVGIPSEGATP